MGADLHVHSRDTGGDLEIVDIFNRAVDKCFDGLGILSINSIAFPDIERLRGSFGIFVIPGVEIEVEYKGVEFKLVVYFRDLDLPDRVLTFFKDSRVFHMERMYNLLEILSLRFNRSIHIDKEFFIMEDVRRHLERFPEFRDLNTWDFVEMLRKEDKWKIQKLEDLIGILEDTNSLTILSAPGKITESFGIREGLGLISSLFDTGVDGIEVWHPDNDTHLSGLFSELAKEKEKIPSGGSNIYFMEDIERFGFYNCPREYFLQIIERLK